MKTIEELRRRPRSPPWDRRRESDAAERFMLTGTNPMPERLEAGQMVFDMDGFAEEPFTEKDLREWGGISGPDFLR